MDVWLETQIAEAIARMAHMGQVTRSENLPYIDHPRRVAGLVPFHAEATGWLHDVLEDCDWMTPERLLVAGISPDTVVAVQLLTRTKAPEGASREWRDQAYDQYITAILASNNQRAMLTKYADLTDNLRPSCPEKLRKKYEQHKARFEARGFSKASLNLQAKEQSV